MSEHPDTGRFVYWHNVRFHIRRWAWRGIMLIACAILVAIVVTLSRTPSNDRDWAADHAVTTSVRYSAVGNETLYEINGIRTTDYTTLDPKPRYYADRILASEVRDVWFIHVPFAGPGAAHTFLSFGLDDGTYLSVSVEARREFDERYSIWSGLFDQYEIYYVVADERDSIGRRVVVDNDRVYLYKTIADRRQAQAIFDDVMRRVSTLALHPEMYNTILNNCTTNIADHVNSALGDGTIPWDWTLVAPKKSDAYAMSLGFLDVASADIELERKRHLVNEAVLRMLERPDFSKAMRTDLGLIDPIR